jgi:hypothetical protein
MIAHRFVSVSDSVKSCPDWRDSRGATDRQCVVDPRSVALQLYTSGTEGRDAQSPRYPKRPPPRTRRADGMERVARRRCHALPDRPHLRRRLGDRRLLERCAHDRSPGVRAVAGARGDRTTAGVEGVPCADGATHGVVAAVCTRLTTAACDTSSTALRRLRSICRVRRPKCLDAASVSSTG